MTGIANEASATVLAGSARSAMPHHIQASPLPTTVANSTARPTCRGRRAPARGVAEQQRRAGQRHRGDQLLPSRQAHQVDLVRRPALQHVAQRPRRAADDGQHAADDVARAADAGRDDRDPERRDDQPGHARAGASRSPSSGSAKSAVHSGMVKTSAVTVATSPKCSATVEKPASPATWASPMPMKARPGGGAGAAPQQRQHQEERQRAAGDAEGRQPPRVDRRDGDLERNPVVAPHEDGQDQQDRERADVRRAPPRLANHGHRFSSGSAGDRSASCPCRRRGSGSAGRSARAWSRACWRRRRRRRARCCRAGRGTPR